MSSTQPPNNTENKASRTVTNGISPANSTDEELEKKSTKPKRRSHKQLDLDKRVLELELLEETKRTQQLRNANQEMENQRFRFDLYLRLIAAILIPAIVIFWLVRVLSIVTAQQSLAKEERLSDVVLAALLGTTSITVIGMMGIVVRYLFTQPLPKTSLPIPSPTNSVNY